MTTIHGVCRSRASRNFWLAGELGITLGQVPVIQAYRLPDPSAADAPVNTLSPAFLALAPAGAIPVLEEDDGFVLSESIAINFYLAKKHGGPLAPADLREDALMLQWAFYGMTAVEPEALAILFAHGQGRAGTPAGRAEIADHAARLARPLKVIDAHLARERHMVGGRFTVADINMAEIVRYAAAEPGLIEAHPALKSWLDACQARPAFQAMWEMRLAEPA